ncbi:MAG: Non-heme chloroperoxidase, partial [uncultured Gemmatimonadaceae bacterium]
ALRDHHRSARHGALLRGPGSGTAGGPDPRLAAEPPHVGGADHRAHRGRLPVHRVRPPRLRRFGQAGRRLRLRHLRLRPRRPDDAARPAGRRARRLLDGRRRGRALHRALRHGARGQGDAPRRRPALPAQDRRQPRRRAAVAVRRHARGGEGRPRRVPRRILPRLLQHRHGAVAPRPRAVQQVDRLARLAARHAAVHRRLRHHRLPRRPREDRRPHARRPRQRGPHRPDRHLGAQVARDDPRQPPRGARRCAARLRRDPRAAAHRADARLPEVV